MSQVDLRLFDIDVWKPALEKYGGVTHLTVALYDKTGAAVCGPVNPTPLWSLFEQDHSHPDLFSCAVRECLADHNVSTAFVVGHRSGLAVVSTPLVLNGEVVGAAVAGYHLLEFPQPVSVERLAREASISYPALWDTARQESPVAKQRFVAQGELLQVLGDTILRETHRTRQYEETAAELRAAAMAKDEFLAVLSHELRTPLTPILGWARMLRLGKESSRVQKAAEVIERNTLLQTKLVEDLLELTRVTRGKIVLDLKACDLGQALHGALEAFVEEVTENRIVLEVQETPEPLFVDCDVNRLQQIFRNVLSNALKFTPAGGHITVSLTRESDQAAVKIRDTGEGIEPEFLPHVFDIFRQQEHGTRRKHEGLGIGLALVKRLTELLGGDVAILSEGAGRGTEVTIRFPLASAPEREFSAPRSVVGKVLQELGGLRLLVVEDTDDSREMTQLILEQLGADVLVARDGVEGLDIAASAAPDVVLCDLRMPRMDGFEFIRALHDRCGDHRPPVIAISGLASRCDHARTEDAGFAGHLDKPFDDAALLGAVSAVMARRRLK